ncbi:Hypothetical protein NTJ_06466 [Nesidiocoris tenuis]|uniref:Uncharacterized protein n=1 Tax=Nesidiocoris tenuis TaxID=355587 RepID=A0ABN7AN47_9HEMI|nr:Hypothetical protein NTJ_06466 [Nesidiocoris tenuis]
MHILEYEPDLSIPDKPEANGQEDWTRSTNAFLPDGLNDPTNKRGNPFHHSVHGDPPWTFTGQAWTNVTSILFSPAKYGYCSGHVSLSES